MKEYQVIGRKLPSDKDTSPKLYRMRVFAPNDVVAKSRFWYYLRKLRKVKKAAGELVGVNQVRWTEFPVVTVENSDVSETTCPVTRSLRKNL